MDRYLVRTFGCQMNKHDSERISGLLASEGMQPTSQTDEADVIVFNTCCVREKAEERFRGQVASLASLKRSKPSLLIAVGGCAAQKDGDRLLRDLPHVDVVFGTHNISDLPTLLARARDTRTPVVGLVKDTESFAGELPSKRDTAWHAWLPIMVGCDNHCTYCIVPAVRGGERSRPVEDLVTEASSLVSDGVVEVTLLGQNVNSYGRDLYGSPRFADVLEQVAGVGVERIRFTTSHPKDLSQETIDAIARTPAVCHHLHLPLQSGSSDVLGRMNRTYSKDDYLALVERIRAAVPDMALSTDIMVGFPGETDADFQDTMDVVRSVCFDSAFTFIFSPREGTPAAHMPDQIPREIAQPRFDILVQEVNRCATERNEAQVGRVHSVLIEGPSKRDQETLAGRTSTNKVVHFPYPKDGRSVEPGTLADVEIIAAHTWFLEGKLRASHA